VRLLLDTQLLVWVPLNDRRISDAAAEAIRSPDNSLYASAVVAFEFADLQMRKRFPVQESVDFLAELIGVSVLDFPADAWRLVDKLPDIHRDPVDRMLIAHAAVGDFTLITADANLRRYPVKSLW
jgi:PIN domain nuclease of toxin-antitoxin system